MTLLVAHTSPDFCHEITAEQKLHGQLEVGRKDVVMKDQLVIPTENFNILSLDFC